MSRTRYVPLMTAETTILESRAARRRATLEEELLAAYAASDAEMVSRLAASSHCSPTRKATPHERARASHP